jgi:hypothetical protein
VPASYRAVLPALAGRRRHGVPGRPPAPRRSPCAASARGHHAIRTGRIPLSGVTALPAAVDAEAGGLLLWLGWPRTPWQASRRSAGTGRCSTVIGACWLAIPWPTGGHTGADMTAPETGKNQVRTGVPPGTPVTVAGERAEASGCRLLKTGQVSAPAASRMSPARRLRRCGCQPTVSGPASSWP